MGAKKILLIIIYTLSCYILDAQKPGINFHSINSVELLADKSIAGWRFQTINGIAYGNFFSGIGIAADYHHFSSYLLFFDQQIFFSKRKKLFAYGDLGYNCNKKKDKPEGVQYTSYHLSGGMYYGAGIGFQVLVRKQVSVIFSAGFDYKKSSLITQGYPLMVMCDPCVINDERYHYTDERIVLKGGISF